jgi:dual specificity MAP kinase phosphatase
LVGSELPGCLCLPLISEPFAKIQAYCPHLVNLDAEGRTTENSALTDLFEREAQESRIMTRGSEVVEGLWVGNDWDVPGVSADGVGATVQFDVCVSVSHASCFAQVL